MITTTVYRSVATQNLLVGDEYIAWIACGMNGSPCDVISDANCWLAMAAATAAPNPGGYGECGMPVGLPLSPGIGIIVRTEIITVDIRRANKKTAGPSPSKVASDVIRRACENTTPRKQFSRIRKRMFSMAISVVRFVRVVVHFVSSLAK